MNLKDLEDKVENVGSSIRILQFTHISIVTVVVLANVIFANLLYMEVRKNSVHPIYGRYDQKMLGCSPWDACKPDNKYVNIKINKDK